MKRASAESMPPPGAPPREQAEPRYEPPQVVWEEEFEPAMQASPCPQWDPQYPNC
jgi:hypothetical protein